MARKFNEVWRQKDPPDGVRRDVKQALTKIYPAFFILGLDTCLQVGRYQVSHYHVSDIAAIIYASWLNRYIGLFITACSDMSQDKYNHGYKWTMERLLKSSMMLPADERGNPDYAFMEQYGKHIMLRSYQKYFDYISRQARSL